MIQPKVRQMLKEHINDIMIRWSPKERRGSGYDPVVFLETPEQARKLLRHLDEQLGRARRERNRELVSEIEEILARVEGLARRFFQWERSMARSQEAHDLREIAKLPLRF
ncbi:MAG: hypothetical protein LDL33_13720 [Desulfomonile sp.]|nr:hypothetical protein [Desulfomonile sp.]